MNKLFEKKIIGYALAVMILAVAIRFLFNGGDIAVSKDGFNFDVKIAVESTLNKKDSLKVVSVDSLKTVKNDSTK